MLSVQKDTLVLPGGICHVEIGEVIEVGNGIWCCIKGFLPFSSVNFMGIAMIRYSIWNPLQGYRGGQLQVHFLRLISLAIRMPMTTSLPGSNRSDEKGILYSV